MTCDAWLGSITITCVLCSLLWIPKQSTHQRKFSRRNDSSVCSTLTSVHYLHKVRVYLTTLVIIINFPDKYKIHCRFILNYVPFENYHREINIMLTWNQKGKALFSPQQGKINVFVMLHELTLSVMMQLGWWVLLLSWDPSPLIIIIV